MREIGIFICGIIVIILACILIIQKKNEEIERLKNSIIICENMQDGFSVSAILEQANGTTYTYHLDSTETEIMLYPGENYIKLKLKRHLTFKDAYFEHNISDQ